VTRGFTLASLLAVALAATVAPGAADRTREAVVMITVDHVSFEELLSVPLVRSLARAGGASLMSPRTVPGDRGPGAYLTLGTGARSAGPDLEVKPEPLGSGFMLRTIGRYVETNEGRSVPGLLGSTLLDHGIGICAQPVDPRSPEFPGLLVAMDRSGAVDPGRTCGFTLLDVGSPWDRAPAEDRLSLIRRLVGSAIRFRATGLTERMLILVVVPSPSPVMDQVGDELTPIAMAEGDPDTLVAAGGAMGTLASDTTRRVGLVSNEDVAPTVLEFFGIPIPEEMNGSPIRVLDGPPPFELHEKHLANRRMTVPVQAGAGVAVVVMGAMALGAVLGRRRLPPGLVRAAAVLPLCVLPLGVALLAAGRLPDLSYLTVVPFLAAVALAGALAAVAFLRRGPLVPMAALGAAALAYLVFDALTGWPDTMFTFIGGTALDGARFYGLPNNMIGVLAGGGLFVAATLRAWTGFVVLVGLGLFAGFPDLGANLGAAVTLFAAAGLWLGLAERGRLGWREVGVTVLVVAVGLVAVLVANRYLAGAPTHATRLVDRVPGEGLGGIVDTVAERLVTGWRLLLRNPLGFVPVMGLPVLLALAVRPPDAFQGPFTRHPRWRQAIVVLVVAGMVAFVANDTGVAAAGFAFGLALAAMLYLPLADPGPRRAVG
jgi:hypothetical protein